MDLIAFEKFPLEKNCLWKNGSSKIPELEEETGVIDGKTKL